MSEENPDDHNDLWYDMIIYDMIYACMIIGHRGGRLVNAFSTHDS